MDDPIILYVLAFSSVFLAARSLIDFGRDARDKSLVNQRLKVQSLTRASEGPQRNSSISPLYLVRMWYVEGSLPYPSK